MHKCSPRRLITFLGWTYDAVDATAFYPEKKNPKKKTETERTQKIR